MSVHLKVEENREGVLATLSQRDADGQPIGQPSVSIVASAAEAKQRAKALARSLGLKVYGFIDKTRPAARPEQPPKGLADTGDGDGRSNTTKEERPPPWLVPGVGKSL
jgi:phosphoribosylpyrophosphate synthetase